MSYILDALRRADAERDRGEVPGLHTQQFGVLPGDDEAPRRPRVLIGTIVLLVIALGGVLAWNLFGTSEPPKKLHASTATSASASTTMAAISRRGRRATSSSSGSAPNCWVCRPGTAPRSRSASARRRASRMYDMA